MLENDAQMRDRCLYGYGYSLDCACCRSSRNNRSAISNKLWRKRGGLHNLDLIVVASNNTAANVLHVHIFTWRKQHATYGFSGFGDRSSGRYDRSSHCECAGQQRPKSMVPARRSWRPGQLGLQLSQLRTVQLLQRVRVGRLVHPKSELSWRSPVEKSAAAGTTRHLGLGRESLVGTSRGARC